MVEHPIPDVPRTLRELRYARDRKRGLSQSVHRDEQTRPSPARRKREPDLVEFINQLLRRYLRASGFNHSKVRIGRDHDGDEVIFVDAYYRATGRPLDARAAVVAHSALRRGLVDRKERRFPHLRHLLIDECMLTGRR